MFGTIYIIKNKCNNKVYIGQTTQPIEKRLKQHLYSSRYSKSQILFLAIRELGEENFYVEPLATAETREELYQLEEYFISQYGSMHPNGYNKCPGGRKWRRKGIMIDMLDSPESDEVCNMYKSGKSSRNIAEEIGISHGDVLNILKRKGVKSRPRNCNLPNRTSVVDKETLSKLFLRENKSVKEIAEFYGVSDSSVRRAIRRFKLREYNVM